MTGWDSWKRELFGTRWTASYPLAPLLWIWECSWLGLSQVVTPDSVPRRMIVTGMKGPQGQSAH